MAELDSSAVLAMVEDLNRAMHGAEATQRRISAVTGTAWSEDRLIKAVVGPRGQLIELEIDPRAVRRVNTEALAATITATVRAAAEQAMGRTRQVVEDNARELRDVLGQTLGTAFGTELPLVGPDYTRLILAHDADLVRDAQEDDHDPTR